MGCEGAPINQSETDEAGRLILFGLRKLVFVVEARHSFSSSQNLPEFCPSGKMASPRSVKT
jgi:hypothetical protein